MSEAVDIGMVLTDEKGIPAKWDDTGEAITARDIIRKALLIRTKEIKEEEAAERFVLWHELGTAADYEFTAKQTTMILDSIREHFPILTLGQIAGLLDPSSLKRGK